MLGEHKARTTRLDALEKKYDRQFTVVFDAIRELMSPPREPRKRPIGFVVPEEKKGSRSRTKALSQRPARTRTSP
jgi:hypothetical protein